MFEVQTFMFWLLACLTGLCAIATVVSQNIVRSATWLLFTLAGTSGIFFLLGADIVGAIQLLVYVGGTMVLVVFGVMLTAQGPFISMKTSGADQDDEKVHGNDFKRQQVAHLRAERSGRRTLGRRQARESRLGCRFGDAEQ